MGPICEGWCRKSELEIFKCYINFYFRKLLMLKGGLLLDRDLPVQADQPSNRAQLTKVLTILVSAM